MNKSKFLKKSLAMVLAIMMVVAMIPLSASAAEPAPAVGYITVDGANAEGSGTEFTATVSSVHASNFTIGVILAGGKGLVYDVDGNPVADGNKDGVFEFTNVNLADLTDGKFQFTIYDNNGEQGKMINVKITQTAADNDATLKTFTVPSQYGATVIDNGANTVTLTVPYGYQYEAPTVETTSKKATYTMVLTGGSSDKLQQTLTGQSIKVVAESGASKNYQIIVKAAEGFTAYSEPDQTRDAVIYDAASTTGTPRTIDVVMPFDTENVTGKTTFSGSSPVFGFKPTFTTAYPSVKVTYDDPTTNADDTNNTVVKSGETTVYVADDNSGTYPVTFKLNYTSNTGIAATETWTINYKMPTADPVAALESLSVGSYRAEIEGNVISLELPSVARVNNGTITVGASANTKVKILGTGNSSTTGTLSNVDLTKNSYVLRVTAPGQEVGATSYDVKEYTLNIATAEPEQAQVTNMYLTDAKGENECKAVIDNNNNVITFTVPFSVKDQFGLNGWKLFYTVTSGSSIVYGNPGTAMPVSGSSFTTTAAANEITYFPTTFDGKATGTDKITVETAGFSKKVYSVKVQRGTASTDHALTSFAVTSKNAYKDLADSNTFKGTISTSAINIEVPFSSYGDVEDAGEAYTQFAVSEKAKLYYIDASGTFNEIIGVVEDQKTPANTLPTIDGNYDGVVKNSDGSLKSQKIVVVSEKGADNIVSGATAFDATYKVKNAGQFTEYNLIVKQKAASATTQLKSFSLYNSALDTTVDAAISGDTLTLTVPYNFVSTYSNPAPVLQTVFEKFNGEIVTDDDTPANTLTSRVVDSEGNQTVAGTTASITIPNPTTKPTVGALTLDAQTVSQILLKSEDGQQSGFYNVVVNVLPAEKGAVLNNVTINNVTAQPDAKNNIKVTLPYGSEVTALKVSFNASKNAVIKYNNAIIDPDKAYNFTQAQSFVVESEDGTNTNTYKISVDTADQFNDVDTDDWFYNDVMTAAANGWISGTGNGNFSPANGMKRGDFALMITRVINADLSAYEGETAFPDIPADKYYAAAVAYCVDKGYLSGYEDGKFYGERTIDRNAMAKVICEVKGLDQVTSTANPFADDAKIPTWAKGYVYACAEAGIILGDTNNNFNGSKTAKRCEAAAVLVRAFA